MEVVAGRIEIAICLAQVLTGRYWVRSLFCLVCVRQSAVVAEMAGEFSGPGFAIPLAGGEKTTPQVLKGKEMP